MFKKFVRMLIACNTTEEVNRVCGEIDRAYQQEKISYKDNEMLFDLAVKIDPNLWRTGVSHIGKEN